MTFHGVPYNLMLLAGSAIVLGALLHKTVYGRSLYIVGGNPATAHLVGIRVHTITIVAYIVCSCLAAVAGLVVAGNVGMFDNYVGRGFELDSIVAAVIGGIVLTGGRGNLFNALLGAAILTVLSNAVLLVGVLIQFQIIMKGVVVIRAAAFYMNRTR
jgi:ribose/xylose/arabinose/galactoside ABC-type transport system permease subunit